MNWSKDSEIRVNTKSCICFYFSLHCPTGFNYSFPGFSKFYAVLNDRVDWNTAQQRCRQLHPKAQLAVIMNSQEGQITSELIRDHGIIPITCVYFIDY